MASVAMHTQARFGAPCQVTDALDRLERRIDAGIVNPMAAHARNLATANPQGLQDVAAAFADLGADLLAADAAADAAVAWTREGHSRNAAAATRQALDLAGACQGATTPALQSISARARLTPAEHETAVLAAAGHSNKAIADELILSVRSVENRLQRVYEKLGISSRAALPHALDLATPRPAAAFPTPTQIAAAPTRRRDPVPQARR
jgi:DNA-binding CsgD family transcriptional regulator